jgi:hypothetical protein
MTGIRKDGFMKNTLTDLNNYLFEQIERLQDDALSEEEIEREIKRSEGIHKIAKTIIENGSLALSVKKHMDEYGTGGQVEIPLLGITNE